MRYVDDLTKVKPEEIQHIRSDTGIQAIIEVKYPAGVAQEIIVVWEDGDTNTFSKDGRYYPSYDQEFIFKSVKKEGWINIYSFNDTSSRYSATIFDSEEDAIKFKTQDTDYITTTKITWTE